MVSRAPLSYRPVQQAAPSPTSSGSPSHALPIRLDKGVINLPVSSMPYIELMERPEPETPKELPPQAEFAMAPQNLHVDGEPGYMGIFVNQTNFGKQELAYFVEQIKTERSVFGVLRSMDIFQLDSRWTRRHLVLNIVLEICCFILSFMMWQAMADVTNLGEKEWLFYFLPQEKIPLVRYIASYTFAVSWSIHVITMAYLWYCRVHGPSSIEWWLDFVGFIGGEDEDDDDEEEMDLSPESPESPPKSVYMLDPRTGSTVEVEVIKKDHQHPERALKFEEQTSFIQILFTVGLLSQFLQFFVYLFFFAHAYSSMCPTERGPYSCQRMTQPVTMTKSNETQAEDIWHEVIYYLTGFKQTHFAPPRYMASVNGTYPLPHFPQSERVPYAMALPDILGWSRDGKEWMCICAHCIPILFGLYWVNENRRVNNLLVNWAEQQSGSGVLTGNPDNLKYRHSLMFLAMIYHTVLPRAKHVMHRFGSLFLDLVDIQDFWSLLVEFDLYEGREIEKPYMSFLGFDLCSLNKTTLEVVCRLEECTKGYQAAVVPDWWLPYKDKYSPCTGLEEAAKEWFEGNYKVWQGHERGSEFWYQMGLPRSREPLYVIIKVVYVVSLLVTLLWPIVLYFRHGGNRMARGQQEVGCMRKFMRAGLPNDRKASNKVDNKEALWNAWRALVVNATFLFFRVYTSSELGILASSLLIKNTLLVASSSMTISQYFVWSWTNPNKWPEMHESRGGRKCCDKMRWCGVACLPRWCFLKVLGWWMPKVFVVEMEKTEDPDGRPVDAGLLKELLGREDDDQFYRELTIKNEREEKQRVLKAGKACFVFPGVISEGEAVEPRDQKQMQYNSLHRYEITDVGKHVPYEDFQVEKHVVSHIMQTLA